MSLPPPPGDAQARVRQLAGPPAATLTWVELVWIEKRIEHWIRFGRVAAEEILDRRRRRVAFADGVFALMRWTANDVGTIVSRIDIIRTVETGAACATVPGVTPGGELLLRLAGWSRVRQALQAIDAIEALGIEPADVDPDHWRHLHNRLAGRVAPHAYTMARHRAWRLRRSLGA